jgi:peroxiredoxin
MPSSAAVPAEREVLFAFVLPDHRGRRVDIDSFRQRRNLVLCFLQKVTHRGEALLREMAAAAGGIAAEEGVVFAVVAGTAGEAAELRRRLKLPFPVLADEGGRTVRRFCADTVSLYVADRFREVFAARHGEEQLSRDEILEWLAHINRQCPE